MTANDRGREALAIFRAALDAADPARAVHAHVRLDGRTLVVGNDARVGREAGSEKPARYPLADFDRIFVVGAGKAALAMAGALEDLLGDRVIGGCIAVPDGVTPRLRSISVLNASHPYPDARSVAAGREIARMAASACSRRDLLLCVISGGASALMSLPAAGVTLAMKKRVTKLLQTRGATIHELNAVRKHLSAIKGGHLAKLAHPATVVSLILSDVIGDDLSAIGSGPTVPDRTTCEDASRVLKRYGIAPLALSETPKPRDAVFRRVRNVIVGSNRQSIEAARTKAESLGYRSIVLSTTIDGETRDIARMHGAAAHHHRAVEDIDDLVLVMAMQRRHFAGVKAQFDQLRRGPGPWFADLVSARRAAVGQDDVGKRALDALVRLLPRTVLRLGHSCFCHLRFSSSCVGLQGASSVVAAANWRSRPFTTPGRSSMLKWPVLGRMAISSCGNAAFSQSR